MILVLIALFFVVLDLVKFIGWVALSCIHTDVVLDDVISKLQCSVLHVRRAMNRVPIYAITSMLG